MRSTCGRAQWLFDSNNAVVGVSLGSDATTEHDLGTRTLAESFGYDYGAKAGVKARKVTKLPPGFGVSHLSFEGENCLLLSSSLESARRYVGSELRFPRIRSDEGTVNTAAAWDQYNFAILCRGADIEHLKQLENSFRVFDVMAGGLLSKLYPFAGGLMYAIASSVPEELLANTQLELDDQLLRGKLLEASGIKKRLLAAGKSWFSLDQTAWADPEKKVIRVWLNPEEQHKYDSGWFTLAELEQWVSDEGPVMIRNRARTA